MATAVTLIHMTTECSGSTGLNGAHGTQMITGHVMGSSVIRAVVTEYIRNLDTTRSPHTERAYEAFGALSRGLSICARFSRLTCRYTVVVFGDLCPRRSWIW